MNSNKEHFGQWKKRSRFIKLSDEYSKQFLSITSFRNQVLGSVMNSSSQIAGSFLFESTAQADLSALPDMKRIVVRGCGFTSGFFPIDKQIDEFSFNGKGSVTNLCDFRNSKIVDYAMATVS
jgi:hypothetical protein